MILPLALLCSVSCTGFVAPPKAATTPAAAAATPNPAPAAPGLATLQIATNALPVGAVQSSYNATLAATGGVPPYSWSTTGGQLPTGLTLNSVTGTIAGTPARAGTFSFATAVSDSKATSSSAILSLAISAPPAPANSVLPVVAMTAPVPNSRVSGTVSISATASDPQNRIASVQFYLDGSRLGPAQTSGPYALVWDTTQVADGSQNLSAIATDAAGETVNSAAVSVTVSNTSWNPAVLGVPWASDFASIATNEIDVKMDPRLKVKATGDGGTDDTSAIRAAIQLASSTGGGVVYFPTGDYKITTPSNSNRGAPLIVPSKVILRGNSSTSSRIFVNDPNAGSETDWFGTWGGIEFQGSSLSGMTDLGIHAVNSSTSRCAMLWNRGSAKVSELFFNNLDVHLDNCRNLWFEDADRLLVQNSQFDSNSLQDGPIYIVGNSNVSFINNKITYHCGRVHLQNNTNLLMRDNTLIRDAENKDMDERTGIESGGVELSFGQNVQVLNNTIQTLNAPTNETGDGEAIMSQESNTQTVLDAGNVTAIGSTTLTDTSALWGSVTASRLAKYPEVVAILTGSGAGEWRTVQDVNTSTKTVTVSQAWNPVPEVGSLYSIFPWTLMHANIQGNTLIDNPNGIVLWDGCYDCTVQDNTLTNSRGIILRTVDEALDRSLYPEGRRVHQIAVKNKILNNTVSNTSGLRPAYIVLDAEAFEAGSYRGVGIVDIQVAGNTIKPYSEKPSQAYNPTQTEIQQEGFFPCFLFGPAASKDPVKTVFQKINFWNNTQSVPVSYGPNFLPLATRACVTTAPPDANTP